jgi:flotillin
MGLEPKAMEILKVKEAEAQGIKLVAFAEAEGLLRKAEAWNTYGEAARLNLVLEAYKTVAGMGANALGQIKFDKVVALDGGSGSGDSPISRMMTAAPGALLKFMEQMRAATGIDIEKLVGGIAAKNEPKVVDQKKE